jgi:DNA-binding NarL/FixJ family response regulator
VGSVALGVTSHGVNGHRRAGLRRLTPRETEVLAAMAEGRTNAGIADALYLSRRAVEKHINSIFSKLWLTGDGEHHPRVQAVLIYLADSGTSDIRTDGSGPVMRCSAGGRQRARLCSAIP